MLILKRNFKGGFGSFFDLFFHAVNGAQVKLRYTEIPA